MRNVLGAGLPDGTPQRFKIQTVTWHPGQDPSKEQVIETRYERDEREAINAARHLVNTAMFNRDFRNVAVSIEVVS